MTEWRIPPSFPYVAVSNSGEVRRPDGTPKRPWRSGAGYLKIGIKCRGVNHKAYVHRLVGEAFCENPRGCREINHKNGKKWDNRAENLEWCTHSENIKHGYATGLFVTTEKQRETARRNIAIYHEKRRMQHE